MKFLPYILIAVLLGILLLQNKSCTPPPIAPPRIDTVVVYEYIHDTIPGKPQYVATKIDTSIWMKKADYKPDTTYSGLLEQYETLGNRYFATNVFRTDFSIGAHGSVSVIDTIYGNWLMGNSLITDLKIPTTTITIEKEALIKNQYFVGGTITGNLIYPISGVYGGLMMKNKRNQLYGISVGYAGEVNYGFSMYYNIK